MKDSVKSWPTDYPDQIDGMDCLFFEKYATIVSLCYKADK